MDHKNTYTIESLYALHNKKVFNIALNLLQSSEDAEDVTQEVFVELYRSLSNFKEKSLISTWIYRIAVNKSLDHLKSQKRKKRFAQITQLFHPISGETLHEISHFNHPGIMLEQKEKAKFLYQAIESLNYNQRTAFVLSQIEHLPQREIAKIMNLNEKALESLIQRAKVKLRDELAFLYKKRRK